MSEEIRVKAAIRNLPRPLGLALEKYPNVVGFSADPQKKIVAGKETEILCIRIYVGKKVPEVELLPAQIIPKEIFSVKTDIVEYGWPLFQQDPHKSRAEVIQGGISFVHYKCTAATLGIVLPDKDTNEPYEVSNTHVIYNLDNPGGECSKVGDPQLQPGPTDGGKDPADQVGNGDKYIPFTATLPGGIADAARAKWNGQRKIELATILHAGRLKGIKEPKVGMVLKGCCRNGDFKVKITDINATVKVSGLGCKKRDRYAMLQMQVMYEPGLGGGSSGTSMYSEDGYGVVLNSFGTAGPGQGKGGGAWFSKIMEPLNLKWPQEGPPAKKYLPSRSASIKIRWLKASQEGIPTRITFGADKDEHYVGKSATLAGFLLEPAQGNSGKGVPNQPIYLLKDETEIGLKNTDAEGHFKFERTETEEQEATYIAQFKGT